MSEPFLAEIRLFGFDFPPRDWAFCDGQILPINQNQSLYSLLGTTYGGDGRTSFGLPDLRGRYAVHFDGAFPLGARGGEETHTLSTAEMPQHTHAARGSASAGDQPVPGGVLGQAANVYSADTAASTALASGTVANAGSGQAHENMQPYTVITFCIALRGTFPSRN